MSDEQAAPETKGVTTDLPATVDLGPEIEGMAGRQLRMRMVTIEPGGVFGPIHDHRDRPGMVYVLEGTITDHRNGVATDYGPGVGWPEDRNTTHWLENRGTSRAVESPSISSATNKVEPETYACRIRPARIRACHLQQWPCEPSRRCCVSSRLLKSSRA
jgi:quercetin dioxygenase-like cupin family protein